MPTYPFPEQIDRRHNSGPPGAVDGATTRWTKGNRKNTLRIEVVPSGPCCDVLDATGLQDSFNQGYSPTPALLLLSRRPASTGPRPPASGNDVVGDDRHVDSGREKRIKCTPPKKTCRVLTAILLVAIVLGGSGGVPGRRAGAMPRGWGFLSG